MPRVKIKHPNRSNEDKLTLLNILAQHEVYAIRIFTTYDGYGILTSNDDEVDKMFRNACLEALEQNNFYPILPPELKAKRTLLLFSLEDHITNRTKEEIKEEIEKENNWTRGKIQDIFKFPNNPILKITFKQTLPATKSKEQGLLMFSMRIPPHQMKSEEYVPVQTCMKCYEIESHFTNQCPKGREYKLCSQCGEEGHIWTNCKSKAKKCTNCQGEHMTLAFQCPLRKAARKNKLEEIQQKKSLTYANASGRTPTVTTPQNTQPLIDQETTTKIMSCMLHAHFINSAIPGSYETELNKALALNNLPLIKIPGNPPSAKILNIQNNYPATSLLANKNQITVHENDLEEDESAGVSNSEEESEEDIPCGQEEPKERPTQEEETDEEEEHPTKTQATGTTTRKNYLKRKPDEEIPPLTAENQHPTLNTLQVKHVSLLPKTKKKNKKTTTNRKTRNT